MNEPPKTIYEVLKFLRAPNGCPWDRVQTSKSVSTCMKEECAEVLEAIDLEDDELLCEELGDLLMNIVFQAVIAEEKGAFTWEDVQSHVTEKMIRRHAHVFGEFEAENPEEVLKLWEKIKAIEKKHRKNDSILDNIAPEIPALDYAEKIQKKVAKYGFDWENQAQIIEKIEEELNELKSAMAANNDAEIDEELGDLLFSVANLARFRKRHSAELLLRQANQKFTKRFKYVESGLKARGISIEDATLDDMENLYQEAKRCL
jgi:MazG family protein